MLVVLDTNVIVSAFHLPESRLAKIVTQIQVRKIDLAISPFILEEVEAVLVSKFRWTKDRAREARELMRSMATTVIDPSPFIAVVKDSEADNRILDCAVMAKADFLITGDKEHLLPLKAFRNVQIISPAEFLERHPE